MAALVVLGVVILSSCTLQLQSAHASSIEWYRTAQGTADRLTRQPDITFSNDFSSNSSVVINRFAARGVELEVGGREEGEI